ncbi:ATP-binding protein [Pseudoruegeria sp. HB172150]|uniref:GAF domain-containing sensor histidine kinase n=1 Tax=Pseudoruegeria sp. HB172150 TaxID=2721164 RepID=UPI0015561AB0|nr:ATP-binding protein [Pseudoruegeria sp. HB172150]
MIEQNTLSWEAEIIAADPSPETEVALRTLYMLAVEPDLPLEIKIQKLLQLGTRVLGMPLGIVSRIRDQSYEVLHCEGPDWAPTAGTYFALGETYCIHTLEAGDVTHFHHAGASRIATHPCYRGFGLESYIGVPLVAGGVRVGTVNFSNPEQREPFEPREIALVRFFARWLGQEWQRREEHCAVARQSALLTAVFDTVPEAIILCDEQRRIRLANPAAQEMFGYSSAELIGRQTSILYPSVSDYAALTNKYYNDPPSKRDALELTFRRREGSEFLGEVAVTPLFNEESEFNGYVVMVRDISERHAMETTRKELISNVSHELRSPVTSILGSLKLLALNTRDLSEKSAGLVDIAHRNAERLQHLVDDILELEVLSDSSFALQVEAIDFLTLLHRAADDMAGYASQHSVEIVVDEKSHVDFTVEGDSSRLLQVLTNLLSNAIKASPEGGTVVMGLTQDGSGFWVRDQGMGIPAELQPVLYDRFKRAREGYARPQSSTGLGMSIVKEIVDYHLGEIRYVTEKGKGTEFTVTVPPRMRN